MSRLEGNKAFAEVTLYATEEFLKGREEPASAWDIGNHFFGLEGRDELFTSYEIGAILYACSASMLIHPTEGGFIYAPV